MKQKLTGLAVAIVVASSFVVISTDALANTHHSEKNMKCYVTTNTNNNVMVMVSKTACDKLGGSATKPSNTMNPSTSSTPPVNPAPGGQMPMDNTTGMSNQNQ